MQKNVITILLSNRIKINLNKIFYFSNYETEVILYRIYTAQQGGLRDFNYCF